VIADDLSVAVVPVPLVRIACSLGAESLAETEARKSRSRRSSPAVFRYGAMIAPGDEDTLVAISPRQMGGHRWPSNGRLSNRINIVSLAEKTEIPTHYF